MCNSLQALPQPLTKLRSMLLPEIAAMLCACACRPTPPSLGQPALLHAGLGQYGRLGNNAATDSSTPVAVIGLTSVASISCGGQGHTCALRQDGVATCWGVQELTLF